GAEFTAFADINPADLDDGKTVLGRLIDDPLQRTYHGAVIGADTALDDLAVEGLPWYKRLAVRHFVPQEFFDAAQNAYAHIAMDERAANVPQSPRHELLASLFQKGIS